MAVDTGKVTGRRTLHLASFAAVIAEAERLTKQPVRTLGNWTVGEIIDHLARSIDESFAGSAPLAPWYARWFLAPLFKRTMLHKGLPPGFQLPKGMDAFKPRPQIAADAALEGLRRATARLQQGPPEKPHAFFGTMTHAEWIQLHLRHAELHFSFVAPEPA